MGWWVGWYMWWVVWDFGKWFSAILLVAIRVCIVSRADRRVSRRKSGKTLREHKEFNQKEKGIMVLLWILHLIMKDPILEIQLCSSVIITYGLTITDWGFSLATLSERGYPRSYLTFSWIDRIYEVSHKDQHCRSNRNMIWNEGSRAANFQALPLFFLLPKKYCLHYKAIGCELCLRYCICLHSLMQIPLLRSLWYMGNMPK